MVATKSQEGPTAEVRHFLSRRLIQRVVNRLGTREIFFQSQSWDGYVRACDSWHDAYWRWVDQVAPTALVERLRGLQADWSNLNGLDWSKLACADSQNKAWFLEQTRQEHLQQSAL